MKSQNTYDDGKMVIRIGTDIDGHGYVLTEDELKEHVAIFGRIGRGKSKLISSIANQLIDQGEGVTLVDPDNDTAEELRDMLLEDWSSKTPLEKRKVFYFEPSFDRVVCIDLFDIKATGLEYEARLSKRIEDQMRIMGRTAQFRDYKEFRQMARILENTLYFCGTNVNGKHFGITEALSFLNFGGETDTERKVWNRRYQKVRPHLPKEVAQDIDRLKALSKTMREREIMSTVNLFRTFLRGPLIKHVLSTDKTSFDFRKAVRQRHTLIWNFGLTDEFSKEQRDALASMVLILEGDACYHERVPRYNIVEEASSVVGAEMNETLRQARKREQRLILIVQDIAGLRNERFDVSQTALSQPGVTISFQQKGREELEELGYVFGTGMLDFSLIWKPMDRPYGWGQIVIPEYGETRSSGKNWQKQNSFAHTLLSGNEISFGKTTGREQSVGTEKGTSKEKSSQKQLSTSLDHTSKDSHSVVDRNQGGYDSSREIANSKDNIHSARNGETDVEGESTAQKHSTKKSQSQRVGTDQRETSKKSVSDAMTQLHGIGGSVQTQYTKTNRVHLLPKTIEEWYPQGLLYSVSEQYAMTAKTLRLLGRGEILICSGNKPTMKVTVDHIPTPFDGLPTFRDIHINKFKTWLSETHKCFFRPEKETQCPQEPVGAVDASKKRKGTNGSK